MALTIEQMRAQVKADATALAKLEADAAAEAKAKDTPRAPEVVLADILANIAGRIGNRPDLRLLLTEFKAATEQESPPVK